MTEPDDPEKRYLSDERAATTEPEVEDLFSGDVGTSRGQSYGTNAGLIAGGRDDPVLLAGIGYPLLGDLALGTVAAYRVASWNREGVAVADCSHTPIAAYQTITAGEHETVVLIGAEKRGDGALNDGTPSENPGTIHEYAGEEVSVPDAEAVKRIGEGAMGANTIENVLVVTSSLAALPADTWVIAVEPAYDSWGMNVEEFTEPVETVLDDVFDRLRQRIEMSLE